MTWGSNIKEGHCQFRNQLIKKLIIRDEQKHTLIHILKQYRIAHVNNFKIHMKL